MVHVSEPDFAVVSGQYQPYDESCEGYRTSDPSMSKKSRLDGFHEHRSCISNNSRIDGFR
jgi:hypothetical protein